MFDNPDAPASTLTKREVLRLVLVHAYITTESSGPITRELTMLATEAVELANAQPPEPPPTPEPAEEVVGALGAELEEAARIARGFEGKADGKTPRAVDAKGGEA